MSKGRVRKDMTANLITVYSAAKLLIQIKPFFFNYQFKANKNLLVHLNWFVSLFLNAKKKQQQKTGAV